VTDKMTEMFYKSQTTITMESNVDTTSELTYAVFSDALHFSEHELTFTFAICCRPSVCLSSVFRLSIVCNACAPYLSGCNFRQFFYGIWYLGHPLTCTENFMAIVPREPFRRVGGVVKPKTGSKI